MGRRGNDGPEQSGVMPMGDIRSGRRSPFQAAEHDEGYVDQPGNRQPKSDDQQDHHIQPPENLYENLPQLPVQWE
jgi:hypothetical protein